MTQGKLQEGNVLFHVLATKANPLIGQPPSYQLAAQAGSLGEAFAAVEVMQLKDFVILCCVALVARDGMIHKTTSEVIDLSATKQ